MEVKNKVAQEFKSMEAVAQKTINNMQKINDVLDDVFGVERKKTKEYKINRNNLVVASTILVFSAGLFYDSAKYFLNSKDEED